MSLVLKLLTLEDVSERYVAWLNDYEVVKFTEQRFASHSREMVREFVARKMAASNEFLYGIFVAGVHVGNIKLGPIKQPHGVGDISYFIGERSHWNKGYSTRAIGEMVKLAFGLHDLQKVTAGVYQGNVASEKALLRNRFRLEGDLAAQVVFEGERRNLRLYGRLRTDADGV